MDTLFREHTALKTFEHGNDSKPYSCQYGDAVISQSFFFFLVLLVLPMKCHLLCVYVYMYVCMYFMHAYMYVDVHVCGGQRLT